MTDISVVIPTRNRAAALGRALLSLCQQTLDPARYEIIVVDNGSADPTPKVVEWVRGNYPRHNLIVVDVPKIGAAQARNAGTLRASAPLVVQTDDDITAPPDWLEKFLAGFAACDSRTAKIGGDVSPVWETPRPAWLSDSLVPMLAVGAVGGDARTVEAIEGCAVCYRREALVSVGGFPETLGRKGKSLLSGESAVDRVLSAKGWKFYYSPSVAVQHNIAAERVTPAWFRRRYFWQGVTDYATRLYLKEQGIDTGPEIVLPVLTGPTSWNFINNGDEPPTEDHLNGLRGLGYRLAKSGFIPIGQT